MLHMLVGRCHVAETNRQVVAYVVSTMKPGVWQTLPLWGKCQIIRRCILIHRENREIYDAVMGGNLS